ncbi:MAG: outer membrane beta-barrel domain-containing protein [Bdellovibrionales bacterium]|nr:outer membrane beta-barrel domain-containing protein [Bdellovibrionales bacterium]
MSIASPFRRSCVVFCALACSVARLSLAQSDAELERQILSGATPKASAPSAGNPTEPAAALPAPAEPEVDKDKVASELKAIDEDVKGPHQIPNEHILVVQYRYIRKEESHEITPFFVGIQPADSFRKQMPWGFSYAYHFTDDFGIEALNVTFLKNFTTSLPSTIYDKFNRFVDRKEPVVSASAALLWTPLKSKAATRENIHYFEGYFIGGGGMTKYEHTSVAMGVAGLGFRLYMSQNAILKIETRDNMDFVSGGVDHRLNILAGASLLFGGASK